MVLSYGSWPTRPLTTSRQDGDTNYEAAKDLKKRQADDQKALARGSERVVVAELKQLATIRQETGNLEEQKKQTALNKQENTYNKQRNHVKSISKLL